MHTLIAALAAVALAVYLATRQGTAQGDYIDPAMYPWVDPSVPNADPIPNDETAWGKPAMSDEELDGIPVEGESQSPSLLDNIFTAVQPATYWPASTESTMNTTNLRAFLDMIAYAEGTSGPDGYRAMFGYPAEGRLIDNFADHPRRLFSFKNSLGQVLKTSAAGRYQFLTATWDELKAKLKLPDFGPSSQDAAATELIRQRGALNDVNAGRVASAISKCKSTWASLPGAGYSQPERSLTSLIAAYNRAGGTTLQA